jgi:hypothetical protein
MREVHHEEGRNARGPWYLAWGWVAGSAVFAWAMANVLDVVSVWTTVRAGQRVAWAPRHPGEGLLIYGLFRLLLTLAIPLGVASASRRWSWMAQPIWGILPVCALATAAAAWWRLLR